MYLCTCHIWNNTQTNILKSWCLNCKSSLDFVVLGKHSSWWWTCSGGWEWWSWVWRAHAETDARRPGCWPGEEGPGEMLLHTWPVVFSRLRAVFSRLWAVWSRGGEGLGAVLPLSWRSGVHGTHSEASLALLLQNGRESHISKSSCCVFPKIFDWILNSSPEKFSTFQNTGL